MIYAIADLHLSLDSDKNMDIFGGWEGYAQKISANFGEKLRTGDTIVLAGDTSWGGSLYKSLADFKFIDAFPGRKIISKGNHDYFWATKTKMERFFAENNLNTLEILHNNAVISEGRAICGTRGWVNDGTEPASRKIILREAQRLELSLSEGMKTGLPILCFLHYPPVYCGSVCEEIFSVLKKFAIKKCYYGHIHGKAHKYAVQGIYRGVGLQMISADYLDFMPIEVV
jgi:predicted phosphohydrolase